MIRQRGIGYTTFSAILFGITPIFAKQAMLAGCSSEMVAFFSNTMACLFILIAMKQRKISFKISMGQLLHLVWIGCIGQAGTNLLLYQSYLYIPVGMATMIHFLYPIIVYGILVLLFHERLEKRKVFGLGIAVIGMLIFAETGVCSARGMLFAFLSGVTFASYIVGIDKAGLKSLHYLTVAFYVSFFSTVFLGVYNVIQGTFSLDFPLKSFLLASASAFGGNVLGKIFLQLGIGLIGSGLAAVISLFEPITSLLMGVVIYGDDIGLKKIMGCIMILGAVLMIAREGKAKEMRREY